MRELPEQFDALDEAQLEHDPVVRMPKSMVALPTPTTYPRELLLSMAAVGLAIGAILGVAGLGVVFALRHHETRAGAAIGGRSTAVRATPVAAMTVADPAPIGLSVADDDASRDGEGSRSYDEAHQRLGRGRTLPMALRALGLAPGVATSVTRALRPLVNMRTLRPTDEIAIQRDRDGRAEIRRIEFRRSDTQVWAIIPTADQALRAERVETVKSYDRRVTGFVVRDSLADALRAAHLRSGIIPGLQQAFRALGLPQSLQRGESVRIVVEEERLNGRFLGYGPILALEHAGSSGRRRGFYVRLNSRESDYFDRDGKTQERGPLFAPVQPPRVTSPFDLRRRHPILHRVVPHLGIDFGAPSGAPVFAAAEGVVIAVSTTGPTGNLVRLRHPTLGVETGYAHLSRFAPRLAVGDPVAVHQVIGYVGSTGRSTGPHLHFSLKRGASFVDPMSLYGVRRSVPAERHAAFIEAVSQFGSALDGLRLDGEIDQDPGRGARSPTPAQDDPASVGSDPEPSDEGLTTE